MWAHGVYLVYSVYRRNQYLFIEQFLFEISASLVLLDEERIPVWPLLSLHTATRHYSHRRVPTSVTVRGRRTATLPTVSANAGKSRI